MLLGHLAFDANRLYQQSLSQKTESYNLVDQRRTDRVVLVVLDSWALRVIEDPVLMPRMRQRIHDGASGVLWAPRQTGTMQGILTLSTGVPVSGLGAIGLVSSSAYKGWTIFDDVVARGERVSFHGGPAWVSLYGNRGTGNFRETGHGPQFREEDLEGMAHARAALLSDQPPTLSVVHITETDVAAHLYGTERPEYAEVIHHWDQALDVFLKDILRPGTTVILTSDHGNDLRGGHGGSDTIYRQVPVLMWGQGIVKGARFEMNAADMPATIAALLDLNAPKDAVALPAVDAIDMPKVERGRTLLTAYFHSLLQKPSVKERPELFTQASTPFPNRFDDPNFAWVSNQEAEQIVPKLRETFSDIEPDAGPRRHTYLADWVFVALTFVAAGLIGLVAWPGRLQSAWWSGRMYGAWLVLLLAVEALFGLRVAFVAEVKNAVKTRSPGLWIGLALGALLAAMALAWIWRHRHKVAHYWHEHQVLFVVLMYLLTTVLYPVNMAGLMGCVLMVVWVWDAGWQSTSRWVGWLGSMAYFSIGTVLWSQLGESMHLRYGIGLPMAVVTVAALIWMERKQPGRGAPGQRWWLLSGIAVALLLFPFSALNLSALADAHQRVLASILMLGLVGFTIHARGLTPWAWLPVVPTLAFWWGRQWQGWALYAALLAGAVIMLGLYNRYRASRRAYPSVAVGMTCLLLTMTSPLHAVSFMAFAWVAMVFFSWRPVEFQRRAGLALAAVLLVAARYGLFDLYGAADSPVAVYLLKHLDLAAAYLGDASRSIGGAVLMVLLKSWLAAAVLMCAPLVFGYWRKQMDGLMALVAMFLLVQVGQASIRAALAVDDLSHQYDYAEFSKMVHTGILVLGMMAYWAVRSFHLAGKPESKQLVSSSLQLQ
ncbi:MAG: alkaline phosphatase [Burkholderiales bacterium]|nr:alkaline phosphatase [Burkholderiales bacterium]